jgi:hypothetical protein
MKKTSTPAGKSRMKFQEKTPKAPAKSGGKSALLDPALCGALLGVLSVLALLLLKDKGTDAGELLLLGRYINTMQQKPKFNTGIGNKKCRTGYTLQLLKHTGYIKVIHQKCLIPISQFITFFAILNIPARYV